MRRRLTTTQISVRRGTCRRWSGKINPAAPQVTQRREAATSHADPSSSTKPPSPPPGAQSIPRSPAKSPPMSSRRSTRVSTAGPRHVVVGGMWPWTTGRWTGMRMGIVTRASMAIPIPLPIPVRASSSTAVPRLSASGGGGGRGSACRMSGTLSGRCRVRSCILAATIWGIMEGVRPGMFGRVDLVSSG